MKMKYKEYFFPKDAYVRKRGLRIVVGKYNYQKKFSVEIFHNWLTLLAVSLFFWRYWISISLMLPMWSNSGSYDKDGLYK